METRHFDAIVAGSGMAGLTAACLLARDGLSVGLLEQNWLPGGCTSSYWRKGFVFESGATTLVGLDQHMPLRYVLERTGIELPAWPLSLPMQVHLKDGTVLNRYQNLDQWIAEAIRVFGEKGQEPFWRFCHQISEFVWETSLQQTAFPPSRLTDLVQAARRVTLKQLRYAGYSLVSTESLLKKYGLLENQRFVEFVNEQLLITAQNYAPQVNVLFGATALCYTNYGNYYMPGGLINLVNPFVEYLSRKGGELLLRTSVEKVRRTNGPSGAGYEIDALHKREPMRFTSDFFISAIPVNNTLDVYQNGPRSVFREKMMGSERLNSAFQMGIAFKQRQAPECIHHQIHLQRPLPQANAASIFLSLNHPADQSRSDEPGFAVASVSTHVHDPARRHISDSELVEREVINALADRGFLRPEDVVYQHSSTPGSWFKWTRRAFGFVGGYPQYMAIKPWQMLDARLDDQRAYICGDTTYPGQGIPGATLSGIIAYEKLRLDHF